MTSPVEAATDSLVMKVLPVNRAGLEEWNCYKTYTRRPRPESQPGHGERFHRERLGRFMRVLDEHRHRIDTLFAEGYDDPGVGLAGWARSRPVSRFRSETDLHGLGGRALPVYK